MGKTFVEKVIGRNVNREVSVGEIVFVTPDYCISHENTHRISSLFNTLGTQTVYAPERIVVVFDHTVPACLPSHADIHNRVREFVDKQKITNFYDMNKHGGVCHQIMCQEGYSAPGLIIAGADSHTCTAGAMGALAIGIGHTEMASVWATGQLWVNVPETIRITLTGRFRKHVTAKDLILKIISDIKADGAIYRAIEFDGDGLENLTIDERMTLCNMGVEMGAKSAACKPSALIETYCRVHAKNPNWEAIWADEDACYEKELTYCLDEIVPGVAKPHNVDNYAQVKELHDKRINQVLIGTCTNGRLSDLRLAAEVLEGNQVKVRTIITPASVQIYKEALLEGTIATLVEAGCTIVAPGCGACIGVANGTLGKGEVCLSTANRNFRGRMGTNEAEIYLASPITAAYSAIYGEIRNPYE